MENIENVTENNAVEKVKGRPKSKFTKLVAFVNGKPRGRGKPRFGQTVEWKEVSC